MATGSNRQSVTFEGMPHPWFRGDWLLKPTRGAPSGLWYRERQFAISYGEWLARAVRWYAERLSTSSDASILLPAPAVTILQMQAGG